MVEISSHTQRFFLQAMNNVLTALEKGSSVNVTGLRGGAPALLIAHAALSQHSSILCITPSERQAALLEQDLALFTNSDIYLYPGHEIPPYTPLSPDNQTTAARLSTLYQALTANSPFILIASAEALLRRVLPKNYLSNLAELLIRGEEVDQNSLTQKLVTAGYEAASLVQSTGEFSIRGGIMDIFPPGFEYPIRLDFFGDTVESIRMFDPISQRSVSQIEEAVLLPVNDILFPEESSELRGITQRLDDIRASHNWDSEKAELLAEKINNRQHFPGIEFLLPLFYDQPASPLDYLDKKILTCIIDPLDINRSVQLTWERINANYQEAATSKTPALPPETLFLSEAELKDKLSPLKQIRLYDLASPDMEPGETVSIASGNHILLKQHIELHRKKHGLLSGLTSQLTEWLTENDSINFACRSPRHAENMAKLLRQHELPVSVQKHPAPVDAITHEEILIYDTPLSQGFDLPEKKIHWLSESELFGEQRLTKKKTKKVSSASEIRFEELNINDIVVHKSHGLGIYNGLVNLELRGISNDFLQITYHDNDKLYVPVDQLNTISKYKGISDKKPKLDKLGGKAWSSRQKKVKEAVWKIAQDLLNLYARRQLEKSRAFSMPDQMFHELEESFPFDETSGQIKAINEVVDDLTSELTMDRLICGDVGYGKTEVAVRAAFKVIEDNYQVAILVPTTVLAEQHTETFRNRLQGFPVRIESLNRFKTTTEQRQIVKDLSDGKVDIVIGTHRILSKDIVFKRLGLLIIDEEHRFGVTHKEKLKKIRANVDVLTLTATPIPRTLQLSLLGIRDLSVISSPPEHRRTVKTFVARHDDLVIKEAVTRELQREGQVFLVHNQVRSIHEVALHTQKLVPHARIAVAHGQMPGKSLEEIMVRFVRQEIDVLVCTTIIESGLDIPNANTIIINRADRLGLAEIYQLRGRVGRRSEQAYAYLLVPSLEGLSKDAQQRLRALMDYNELGGGFKLAMSDLQIRGGGNILGESQSGNIAAVGYDLYLELLQKTVLDLKRKAAQGDSGTIEEEINPEINLQISAYIPEGYINNIDQRYVAYRRITSLDTEDELFDLQDELRDRYGTLPEEAKNLFEIISLKINLRLLKITKLEQGPSSLVFTFHDQTPVDPKIILQLTEKNKKTVRFTPDAKLIWKSSDLGNPLAIFQTAKKILRAIMENDI